MKIVFFGNPIFAAKCLEHLYNFKNINISLVVTNKDKRMGRGLRFNSTDVKNIAKEKKLNLYEINNINNPTFIDKLKNIKPDLFIVVAYKILPYSIYSIPKHGTVNLHASLLPQYIGASPIQYALLNGDSLTGLTTFYINDKIDQGELIHQTLIPIDEHITFNELLLKMMSKSKDSLKNTLQIIKNKKEPPVSRREKSFAPKINSIDFIIEWNENSKNVHNKIRALSYKGAYTYLNNKRIKFFNTFYIKEKHSYIYGTYILRDKYLLIATNDGFLRAERIQIEGKNKINAVNFYNNNNNNNNNIFER